MCNLKTNFCVKYNIFGLRIAALEAHSKMSYQQMNSLPDATLTPSYGPKGNQSKILFLEFLLVIDEKTKFVKLMQRIRQPQLHKQPC